VLRSVGLVGHYTGPEGLPGGQVRTLLPLLLVSGIIM